jgi:AhpD family alkylhydroperoxidase
MRISLISPAAPPLPMQENPMDTFQRECPELASRFQALVEAQISLPGLDPRTRQLVNVAIQTANRNPPGVYFHAAMAREAGASREQVVAAVAMNLHLSGLAPVLDCLGPALEGFTRGSFPAR